jgi:hypothetical protein
MTGRVLRRTFLAVLMTSGLLLLFTWLNPIFIHNSEERRARYRYSADPSEQNGVELERVIKVLDTRRQRMHDEIGALVIVDLMVVGMLVWWDKAADGSVKHLPKSQ